MIFRSEIVAPASGAPDAMVDLEEGDTFRVGHNGEHIATFKIERVRGLPFGKRSVAFSIFAPDGIRIEV